MKTAILSISLMLGLFLAAPAVCSADDSADTAAKPAKTVKRAKLKPEGKAGKAIARLKSFSPHKANAGAKYFILLQSASFCKPCNAEMPHVAEVHKEMKKKGLVEIILVSADPTPDAAKGFLKKYHADLPAVMPDAGAKIPGFQRSQGIPAAQLIDSEGNVLESGIGCLNKWQQYESQAEAAIQAKEEEKAAAKEAKRAAAAEKKAAKGATAAI